MDNNQFNIALCNYAGIPVVELAGKINEEAVAVVEETLERLVSAGHYNLMLNLKKAAWEKLSDLTPLKKVVRVLESHYGKLDVIVDQRRIEALYREDSKPLAGLFRFCTSENQAIRRIKKLSGAYFDTVKPTPAHLAESI